MENKSEEFIKKYELLCLEYGMKIFPQMNLVVGDMPKEDPKAVKKVKKNGKK